MKSEYEAEKAAYLASIHEACRPMHAITYPSFAAWCRERGIEPPQPDFNDPYIASRFAQYMAFREAELSKITLDARASVEACFVGFDDWLSAEEAYETIFGATKE